MTIIVGTDGTGGSRAAVAWAAVEARRRGERLRIVHAFDDDWPVSPCDLGGAAADVGRALGEALVAAARDQALDAAPGVRVETVVTAGPVETTLLDQAIGAQLLVLGHRAGVRLGPVGRRLLRQSGCPVVVAG